MSGLRHTTTPKLFRIGTGYSRRNLKRWQVPNIDECQNKQVLVRFDSYGHAQRIQTRPRHTVAHACKYSDYCIQWKLDSVSNFAVGMNMYYLDSSRPLTNSIKRDRTDTMGRTCDFFSLQIEYEWAWASAEEGARIRCHSRTQSNFFFQIWVFIDKNTNRKWCNNVLWPNGPHQEANNEFVAQRIRKGVMMK